jgi:glycerophosphoryl diester phosphodiesterase
MGQEGTPSATSIRHELHLATAEDLQHLLHHADHRLPLLSAHRGGGRLAFPENCIATFEDCLRHGYTLLEIDPRLTRDDQLVVHHDASLERTTTGSGLVKEHSLASIRQLQLRDSQGQITPHRVPTLDEVLEWARGKAVLVLDQKDASVERRVRAIEQHHAESYALLITGSVKNSQECYRLNPHLMMEVFIPDLPAMQAFEQSGIPWRNIIAFVGHTPPEDRELYRQLHQRGVLCVVGTSRNLDREWVEANAEERRALGERYARLFDLGADLLETDLPHALQPLLLSAMPAPPALQSFFYRRLLAP